MINLKLRNIRKVLQVDWQVCSGWSQVSKPRD